MSRINGMRILLSLLLLIVYQSSSANNLSQVHRTAQSGTVALTFDDGPSPIYTPQILDILKTNNIKATFFVVGPLAKQFPEIIDRMVAEGHAVGIHTMTHPKLTRLNDAQLNHEVVELRDLVHKLIGKSPECLRPPYGIQNQHLKKYVNAHELILVSNGFDSMDNRNGEVDKIVKRVIDNAASGQVFLFHDGYSHREKTVAALPEIIAGIREKGLGFSAICYPTER